MLRLCFVSDMQALFAPNSKLLTSDVHCYHSAGKAIGGMPHVLDPAVMGNGRRSNALESTSVSVVLALPARSICSSLPNTHSIESKEEGSNGREGRNA